MFSKTVEGCANASIEDSLKYNPLYFKKSLFCHEILCSVPDINVERNFGVLGLKKLLLHSLIDE